MIAVIFFKEPVSGHYTLSVAEISFTDRRRSWMALEYLRSGVHFEVAGRNNYCFSIV